MSCLIDIIEFINKEIINILINRINKELHLFHKLIKGEQVYIVDFIKTHVNVMKKYILKIYEFFY